ncbi:hypothetical protein [Natrarchaeobaculum sulfurireducens]|uniref:Uncharacterized protein n=1 Tax=Natrarchaeobaculum sulfurireducens TaxID=2044521 RepID=A0A346PPS6_9EURY|nr:hypothetical protein [Natrarchaeobaculum sulfurireducens]AXR81521.1 hypothetical protein AArcMg_1508 [Natrarchaeobaculum sulfurireducens]
MDDLTLTSVKIREHQKKWLDDHKDVNLSGAVRDVLSLVENGTLSYVNGELKLTPADEDELCDLLGVDNLDEFSGNTITNAEPLTN